MDITVYFNSKYKELKFLADNVSYESGLLDEKEAKELALKLLDAAYELLRD